MVMKIHTYASNYKLGKIKNPSDRIFIDNNKHTKGVDNKLLIFSS